MENKHFTQNIAYYLDSNNSIITFGITCMDEYLFESYLLPEILKNAKCKRIIRSEIYDPMHLKHEIKNSIIVVDLDSMTFDLDYNSTYAMQRAKEIKIYISALREWCIKNNNSAIIRKLTNESLLGDNQFYISPTSIIYGSDVSLMISRGNIKTTKNRYDSVNLIDHSLIAMARDKKIEEILN